VPTAALVMVATSPDKLKRALVRAAPIDGRTRSGYDGRCVGESPISPASTRWVATRVDHDPRLA